MITEPAMAWVEAALRGDEDAARQWVGAFHGRIYAFIRRLCDSEAEALDLTQRTFCRAWSALPGFGGRSTVSTWLHGIAYHTVVDWRRSRRPTEERPDSWWNGLPDGTPSPDVRAAQSDAKEVVFAAVDALEPGLRDTLHLHYYQGLTLEETAEVLGIAASTVKYRIRQALERLQRQLSQVDASRGHSIRD